MNTHPSAVSMPSDTSTDKELVSLALAGNDAAFALIMRRYNRLLFRSARSILKNDDDTQDAVQEAYLGAWRALGSFRSDAKLSTWLVRIAVNEALGRLRRQGQGARVIPLTASTDLNDESPEMQMQANPDEQPEQWAMRAQVRQQIEARIDQLPDQYRTVFMLRGVEELNVEEVATALGIPEATVRSRFFRARSLLREGLSRDIDMAVGTAFSFAGARCDRIVEGVLARIAQKRESSRP
jgi:RNA polymerase sigma-70 factor (ECF subfamily)